MNLLEIIWNLIKTVFNFFLQNWQVCITIVCVLLVVPIVLMIFNVIKSIKEVTTMTREQSVEENKIFRKEFFEKMNCLNDSKIEEAAPADSSLFFESE